MGNIVLKYRDGRHLSEVEWRRTVADTVLKVSDMFAVLDQRVSHLEKHHAEFPDRRLRAELVALSHKLEELGRRTQNTWPDPPRHVEDEEVRAGKERLNKRGPEA